MVHYYSPPPPNLKERILWNVPKYGWQRRLCYYLRYYITLDFIENATRCYDKPNLHNNLKSDLMIKLKTGQFDALENILLNKFELDLTKSKRNAASEFLRSKEIPSYIEESL